MNKKYILYFLFYYRLIFHEKMQAWSPWREEKIKSDSLKKDTGNKTELSVQQVGK